MHNIFLLCLLCFLLQPLLAEQTRLLPQQDGLLVKLHSTHDGIPFDARLKRLPASPNYDGYTVSFPSSVITNEPANNTVIGELYRPVNAAPDHSFPAVVVFHIIGPGNFHLERFICKMLAKNGATALFFQLPFYGQRGGKQGPTAMLKSPELFTQALEQCKEDTKRAVDLLLAFPQTDPAQIGATGVSLGSLMTANAVGIDSRISRALMILGGGDLRSIIATPVYETQALRQFFNRLPETQREAAYAKLLPFDPLTHAPALAKLHQRGRFGMINAAEDHVIPPACSQKLADKVGCHITWLPDADHYTAMARLPEIIRYLVGYFIADRRASWSPPQGLEPRSLAEQLLMQVAYNLNAFLGGQPPATGTAHVLKGHLTATLVNNMKLESRFEYCLGPDSAFRFKINLPLLGSIAAGQDGNYLWFARGTAPLLTAALPKPHTSLIDLLAKDIAVNLRIIAGFCACVAMEPTLTQPFANFTAETATDGRHNLKFASHTGLFPGSFFVHFDQARRLKQIDASLNGFAFSIEVHQCAVNTSASPAMFAPPTTANVQQGNFNAVGTAFIKALEQVINLFITHPL